MESGGVRQSDECGETKKGARRTKAKDDRWWGVGGGGGAPEVKLFASRIRLLIMLVIHNNEQAR